MEIEPADPAAPDARGTNRRGHTGDSLLNPDGLDAATANESVEVEGKISALRHLIRVAPDEHRDERRALQDQLINPAELRDYYRLRAVRARRRVELPPNISSDESAPQQGLRQGAAHPPGRRAARPRRRGDRRGPSASARVARLCDGAIVSGREQRCCSRSRHRPDLERRRRWLSADAAMACA
jgi:hypothetical protein